jgi:phosphate starvation-inducible protein PhoH and related proteins
LHFFNLCKYFCDILHTTDTKEHDLSKRKTRELQQQFDNTISFNNYVAQRRTVDLIPKSLKQEEYVDLLTDPGKLIIFATGPAGTGKTMLAVLAGIRALKNKEVNKIILTRPAVGVDDERHGFLPGDINSKMEPWTKPLFDVMHEYWSPKETARMLEEQIIEIAPIMYLRGRTFKNSWIVVDEAQNMSIESMKMILTRIGSNSKMVITGDLKQVDRTFVKDGGLQDFVNRLSGQQLNNIGLVNFGGKDIQREQIVYQVLKLYNDI